MQLFTHLLSSYLQGMGDFFSALQFEGKSIALDEAKLLCKPIVVTNFSTVHDQFQDGMNGSVCEMNPVAIANAIEMLIRNKNLRKKYIDYLKKNGVDNTSEIDKIYKLID